MPIETEIKPVKAAPKKSVVKKEKEVVEFIWTEDMTYYFISQWQNEPCLFDVNHDDYSLKGKRTLAIERIIENMSAREFDVPTVQQVIDKMNSLRTYFNSQNSKHKASLKQTGKGANKVFKIKWKFL